MNNVVQIEEGRSMIHIFYLYRKMKIIQLAIATPGNEDEQKEEMESTKKTDFPSSTQHF